MTKYSVISFKSLVNRIQMLATNRQYFKDITRFIAKPFRIFHPNYITITSLLVIIPAVVLVWKHHFILALPFVLISFLLDLVDGEVARARGLSSPFGGFLDASIDRVVEGFIFFSFGISLIAEWQLVYLAMLTSIMVSYVKAKGEAATNLAALGTNRFSIGIGGRGERLIITFTGFFLFVVSEKELFLNVTLIVIIVVSTLTILVRMWEISRRT